MSADSTISDASLPGGSHSHTAARITQILILLAMGICYCLFWWVGRLLDIPVEKTHGGSLLVRQGFGQSILDLIAAAVLLPVCTVVAGIFLRGRWNLAGLTAATAGLTAWSTRGGPIREVLFYSNSSSVFLALLIELLLLGSIAAALWTMLWYPTLPPPPQKSDHQSIALSLIAQVIATGSVMLILCQTDSKKQALASIFLASVVGTSIAESYFMTPGAARWYWIGPIAVGAIGYLAAWLFNMSTWTSGLHEPTGMFAALARALPLDYISAGTCGALIGCWWSEPIPETKL